MQEKKRVADKAKRKHVPRKKKKSRKTMTPKVKGKRKVKAEKGISDAGSEREKMVETVAREYLEGPESRFVAAFQENGDPVEAPIFNFFVDPDVTPDQRGDLDKKDDNRTQMAFLIDGLKRQR